MVEMGVCYEYAIELIGLKRKGLAVDGIRAVALVHAALDKEL